MQGSVQPYMLLTAQVNAQKKYDPFACPPNLDLAREHAQAKRIGIIGKSKESCPCCALPLQKEQFHLWCSTRDFAQLGVGYYFYFQYIKICISVLLVIIVVAGSNQIIELLDLCYYNRSDDILCTRFSIFVVALKHHADETEQDQKNSDIQGICNLIAVLLSIITITVAKMYHTLERKYLELAVQSPAQFALYFDNINAKKTEDSELESFLEKYWKREGSLWRDLLPHNARDGACVQKIVRFYRINHYLAAYKKEASLEQQVNELPPPTDSKIRQEHLKLRDELESISHEVQQYEKGLQNGAPPLRTRRAVVVFHEKVHRKFFLKQFGTGKVRTFLYARLSCCTLCSKRRLKGSRLTACTAPHPLDLIFQNQEISEWGKVCRITASYLFFFALLIGTFFLLAFLVSLQTKFTRNNQGLNFYLSLAYSGIIFTINLLTVIVTANISARERRSTYTSLNITIAWKLSWLQFASTAIIPYYLLLRDPGKVSYDERDLITNIFFVVLTNAFVVPLTTVFDPLNLYRALLKCKLQINGLSSKYRQYQAHALMEDPPFDICEKYAVVNRSIFTAALFANIFPLGSVVLMLGLAIYYWACKYVLIRRCSFTNSLSANLNKQMLSLLQYVPLAFALGALASDYTRVQTFDKLPHSLLTYITLALSLFALFSDRLLSPILMPCIRCFSDRCSSRSRRLRTGAKSVNDEEIPISRTASYIDTESSFLINYTTVNPVNAIKQRLQNSQQKPIVGKTQQTYETINPSNIAYEDFERQNQVIIMQQMTDNQQLLAFIKDGDNAQAPAYQAPQDLSKGAPTVAKKEATQNYNHTTHIVLPGKNKQSLAGIQ